MKKVVVFLADGFEEIEALTVVDVLRRAKVECDMCSLSSEYVKGAHNIIVKADGNLDSIDYTSYAALVLPGGMPGAKNLKENVRILDIVKEFYMSGKFVCAICAAPIVLAEAGITDGIKITSYPGFEGSLGNCIYRQDKVVSDGKFITSRGPATAMEFAYEILNKLDMTKEAQKLKEDMLFN
jgi:4-methyl-5(b-hydroxyethyl)-thiazole monophosphate biosynthesis